MDQDIKIYIFIQHMLQLINSSNLSMGEIKLILESLLLTINQQYEQNINTYLMQLQSQNNNNNNNEDDVEHVPFSITIPLDKTKTKQQIIINPTEDSSGQE